jgi:hypothetical protein
MTVLSPLLSLVFLSEREVLGLLLLAVERTSHSL